MPEKRVDPSDSGAFVNIRSLSLSLALQCPRPLHFKQCVPLLRRADPQPRQGEAAQDGRSYTLEELNTFYRNVYTPAEIKTYWDVACRTGREQPKGKKAKAAAGAATPGAAAPKAGPAPKGPAPKGPAPKGPASSPAAPKPAPKQGGRKAGADAAAQGKAGASSKAASSTKAPDKAPPAAAKAPSAARPSG
ncbi:unnamed protein product, partial [Prorocentrum cordatum]